MTTAFGENSPKYGAQRKSCCLKDAVKIKAEMLVKQRNIFVLFTLCWHFYTLHKLFGEMDSCGMYQSNITIVKDVSRVVSE